MDLGVIWDKVRKKRGILQIILIVIILILVSKWLLGGSNDNKGVDEEVEILVEDFIRSVEKKEWKETLNFLQGQAKVALYNNIRNNKKCKGVDIENIRTDIKVKGRGFVVADCYIRSNIDNKKMRRGYRYYIAREGDLWKIFDIEDLDILSIGENLRGDDLDSESVVKVFLGYIKKGDYVKAESLITYPILEHADKSVGEYIGEISIDLKGVETVYNGEEVSFIRVRYNVGEGTIKKSMVVLFEMVKLPEPMIANIRVERMGD